MVAQSVALPAAAETTKIDSSVAQSVAASAASAASAVQSLPKFTSTADLIKQTAQTLAAQGEVHELEQDDAKLEATAQSKAGMSLAALENALADAMYANAAAGKINTEAYGLNKDEMASVMAATIKTYHLSSAVTDLGYETNAAGVVTAVTFTGSSGMTSAMESMTNSDDEVIAQQADSYAQAYVAENSDTFAASAAADGHTYGEPKWYWNDTNPEDGHTHTWKETPDGYWTKTDDGWAYTAVYTCEKDDAYQKVEGTVTKDTTEAKPGAAGKTVYSASVPADKSPVKKEYKEPTTRTDDIAALPCQNHAVPKDADGNFVATFNWEMKKVEGKLADDYSNAQLFYDSETGKISAGAPVTIDWECTSVTFKCAVCGEEIKTQPVMTMPVSVVVDQNNNSVYINVGGTPTLDTTSGGTGVTLVSAMKDGNWYDMQNNPVDASKVNFTYQSGDNKGKNSLLLYDSQKTAVYVDDQGNQVTNTYDVSTAQMNYYYFQLSQFNQDEAEYFGVVAPFWTSKGVQKQGEDGSITGTMGAIKILCSIDPNDDVPPTTMAFMLNMLPQAFMSYVMNYGEALKAIRDAGLAQVAKLGDADYVTKLLILHDWISQVAEFDMGSMGDITGGGNNDPIQTTAFGALLGGEIGAKGVEYGCICLGYAAAFNYMVQNLPDNKSIYKNDDGSWKTPDEVGDNAVVDFAQILYYCDTSDTSVAGNAFGGGMFNNVHYFNAVKVNKLQGDSNSATMTTGEANKNWYYVDVCYDDVNTECMAQTRVENAGDLRHVNFLVSPSGLEGRYSKYYDYIDSLYDGYTYTKNKNPDVDDDGNVVLNNGKPHYSYTKAENKNETRYTDTCYEDTWFTSICSPIYFDNNYFYYVDTTTNQNLYNNMRRQQSENGNNGNSGSGSSGNNSQMQQFMKKMQNQGPDTLEARPRNANYYIRKEDSSSRPGGFSMSSFTKTDDPFDIILMYYNDLKETSSNFNDDDSNAKVLAEAGTIYKIDTSAKDKHAKVENNLNTECLADAAAKRIYPALVHSTALYDGKLYFNVNNAIYRMDPTTGAVEEVKEYNTVYGGIKLTKDKDGNKVPDTHFPGMSMVIMDSKQNTDSVQYLDTFMNHPLAGLTLRDSYSFATTTQQGQTVITGINTTKDQLIVSVGTNLSNTYKELVDGKAEVKTDASGTSYANRKSYKTESWNYNPSYNQNMGSSDEKNKNEEFMWCANLVETMPMSDMVSDLSSGATTNVSVAAWCDTPAYTQDRTTKYGLTKGEKVYADGALPKGHTWALDELETKSVGNNVYLCSDCHTATESTPHTVTLNKVDGVTLTLGTTSNTYIKDDTVTLTVEKEGTDIVTVTAKNGDTDVALTEVQEAAQDEAAAQATTEKAKTVYTFTMPDGDVTINVTKAAKTYAVKVADANKDTLKITSPEADLDKVAEGTSVTVVATPKDGYTLTADGVVVTYGDNQTLKATPDTEKANTYTFAMPAGDATVSAAFEEVKKYNVTVAGTVENGTVGVEPKTAAAKDVVTVTVTPNTNFKYTDGSLKATYTDGGTKKEINDFKAVDGKENTYTFTMPAADVTVSAAFEPVKAKTYSVTATKGGEGTVTVNGQETEKLEGLKSGDTVTLTVTPADDMYKLAQLAENGLKVTYTDAEGTEQTVTVAEGTEANTYTFAMPAADVTVSVQFTTVKYGIVVETEGEGTVTFTDDGETRFAEGTEVTATFKPNGTTYVLTDAIYYVGNTGENITQKVLNNNYTYTFTMPANYVKFEATFGEAPSTEPETRTVHGAAEKTTITAMAVFTCTDKNCASAQFVDATVKQTSGVTTATVNFNGKDYTAKYGEKNGWVEENGKKYWYEKGVKQGTTGRGKEIYDPDSDAWYWLDAVQGGAMTVNKDVYQESAAGQWADKPDGTGKWVRYDENGHMIKGWQTTDKGTYYFDLITGAMAKGAGDIDGVPCAFDEYTGIALDGQWLTIKGADFWYEKGVRQGLDGRGKEIYDPASDAWYWLDSVDQGKKATSKDVYQESEAGQWADRPDGTGKWVRYDAQGHMIKGWSADKRYYFDPIYGTMAKGDAVIDGRTYHFDKNTGVLQ